MSKLLIVLFNIYVIEKNICYANSWNYSPLFKTKNQFFFLFNSLVFYSGVGY